MDVRYVPLQHPVALRRAVQDSPKSINSMRFPIATRARARMISADLSSRSFARRHLEISRELLVNAPCETVQSTRPSLD